MVYLRTSEKEYNAEEENKIKAQASAQEIKIIRKYSAQIHNICIVYAIRLVQQIEAKSRRETEEQRQVAEQEQLAKKMRRSWRRMPLRLRSNEILHFANADSARVNAELANTETAVPYKCRACTIERGRSQAGAGGYPERRNRQGERETGERAEERATRLRMISIGKSMAVKSSR
ncbi:MAG: hypothetical protein R2744_13315 [Bacteroidales bacterium]